LYIAILAQAPAALFFRQVSAVVDSAAAIPALFAHHFFDDFVGHFEDFLIKLCHIAFQALSFPDCIQEGWIAGPARPQRAG